MANFKATWLGDEDPNAQIIRMGDLRFIKGEATDVPDKHEYADLIRDNPAFSTSGKAEVVEAKEPTPDEMEARQDEGTERGALKDILRRAGQSVQGNASVETLRDRVAKLKG